MKLRGVLVQVDATSNETVGSLGAVKCQAVHEPLLVAADDMIHEAVEGHHNLSAHTTGKGTGTCDLG